MTSTKIHAIWSDVLKLSDFSNDDDFFDLGGHSLLMAVVQGRISDEIGLSVPMDKLFRHPTVNQISQYLAAPL